MLGEWEKLGCGVLRTKQCQLEGRNPFSLDGLRSFSFSVVGGAAVIGVSLLAGMAGGMVWAGLWKIKSFRVAQHAIHEIAEQQLGKTGP